MVAASRKHDADQRLLDAGVSGTIRSIEKRTSVGRTRGTLTPSTANALWSLLCIVMFHCRPPIDSSSGQKWKGSVRHAYDWRVPRKSHPVNARRVDKEGAPQTPHRSPVAQSPAGRARCVAVETARNVSPSLAFRIQLSASQPSPGCPAAGFGDAVAARAVPSQLQQARAQ